MKAWIFAVGVCLSPCLGAAEPAPSLVKAVDDLSAREFAVREAATEQLIDAGAAAIEPLRTAAASNKPEAAARALDILWTIYAADDDATFELVETALQRVIREGSPAARDRGLLALEDHAEPRQRRAFKALEEAGAVIKSVEAAGFGQIAANRLRDEVPPNMILFGRNWKGGDEGLKHLRRLEHLPRLKIYRIVGAPISEDALNAVIADMPEAEFQTRGAGCLGISGSAIAFAPVCQVSQVAEDSAADRAGLEANDIIVQFDGQDIRSFDQLIELLQDKEPGDKVPLVYLRNREEHEVVVELTEWK